MPVWQKAMSIAEAVFRITDDLPRKEDYGFTSQIRRSALSISANIAEAYGRKHTSDKVNFYYIARGSLTETQSHLDDTESPLRQYLVKCSEEYDGTLDESSVEVKSYDYGAGCIQRMVRLIGLYGQRPFS